MNFNLSKNFDTHIIQLQLKFLGEDGIYLYNFFKDYVYIPLEDQEVKLKLS